MYVLSSISAFWSGLIPDDAQNVIDNAAGLTIGTVALFIVLSTILQIMVVAKILERLGYSQWTALIAFIPIVNILTIPLGMLFLAINMSPMERKAVTYHRILTGKKTGDVDTHDNIFIDRRLTGITAPNEPLVVKEEKEEEIRENHTSTALPMVLPTKNSSMKP